MPKLPKPTKKTFVQFVIFNFGGVTFFVIGYVTFVILYGFFHWAWLPAKILADFLGWSANFVIQYFWTFREEAKAQKTHKVTARFTLVSLMNLGIDYAIVALLAWAGVTPLIGLIIAANFFTIWKWLWYRHYVFARKHHIPKPE